MQDLTNFVMGMYQQLDEALRYQDQFPTAATLQYVLHRNLYSNVYKIDSDEIRECVVYLMRNMQLLESLEYEAILAGDFKWVD